MPSEPRPEHWQLTLAQTQADRHQAWKACTAVILSEAQPALSSAHCNPINSNQAAHHGDYFRTNGRFKPLENVFICQQRVKPEKNVLQRSYLEYFNTSGPSHRDVIIYFYFYFVLYRKILKLHQTTWHFGSSGCKLHLQYKEAMACNVIKLT